MIMAKIALNPPIDWDAAKDVAIPAGASFITKAGSDKIHSISCAPSDVHRVSASLNISKIAHIVPPQK